MSRFNNLEFGHEADGQSAEQKPVVKDDAYYLAEARAAFESADFEQGLRLYSKVLEYNPQNSAAWAGQARMLIELGEYREAALWADKALEKFPHDSELLAAKAVALGRTGCLQEALAFSDAAIQERGDAPYVWLARGDVMLARRENRADYCFEKALSLAPGDWFIAWLAARIRYFYEQFAAALKLLQQALEVNGGHFLLWLELGHCQQALGLVGAARTSFSQAKQLSPHCRLATLALTRVSNVGIMQRVRGWWRRLTSG
ncbi:MAG TPA: tetratricopeptide repeat protein [Verrucomicrobiae bacterium]